MKAKAGKTLAATLVGFIFLWVLIPIGLYFLGYKLIGPEFGKIPALNTQAEKVENLITHGSEKPAPKSQAEAPSNDDKIVTADASKAPVVDIEVAPANGRSHSLRGNDGSTQPRVKKKKKKTTKPAVRATQPRDDASGDAAMPGGGDRSSDPGGQ